METRVLYGDDWLRIASLLPVEIEEIGRETKAFIRPRQIRSSEMLLRILLAYASENNSLEKTVSLASNRGWAKMSANALHLRLRSSEEFVQRVFLSLLSRSTQMSSKVKRRIRVVDGTFLSGPAAKTSDFTLHVQYDPVRGHPVGMELANGHAGESFRLHSFGRGDLVMGDGAYGKCRGIDSVLGQGADLLVRIHPQNIRLIDAEKRIVKLASLASQVPKNGSASFELFLPIPADGERAGGWATSKALRIHPVRVVATYTNKKKILWLLTNLPEEELSTEDALDLYRERWQIELFFKRLKSILDLDELPSRDPTTARPWIYLKMIAAILALKLSDEVFSPCEPVHEENRKPMEENHRRSEPSSSRARRTHRHRHLHRPDKAKSAQAVLFLENSLGF